MQRVSARPQGLSARRLPARVRCSAAAAAQAPQQQPQASQDLAREVARSVVRAVTCSPVALVMKSAAAAARGAVQAFNDRYLSTEERRAAVRAHVKQSVNGAKWLVMAAPFAAVSSSGTTFLLITRAVASFIKMYLLLLFLRVLLSWFPTFDWNNQPWLALRQVTDPYLNLFRGIIPPLLGQIDLTPLVGFFLLQVLAGILEVPFEDEDW